MTDHRHNKDEKTGTRVSAYFDVKNQLTHGESSDTHRTPRGSGLRFDGFDKNIRSIFFDLETGRERPLSEVTRKFI